MVIPVEHLRARGIKFDMDINRSAGAHHIVDMRRTEVTAKLNNYIKNYTHNFFIS
jgi:hypothetical protein